MNNDFGGTSKTYNCPGSSNNVGFGSFGNDKASSLKVGSGVRARFCKHNCPGGNFGVFEIVGPYTLSELDDFDNTMSNL